MKTGKSAYNLRLGILFVMLCIFGIAAMAQAAAPVSQVPIGPRDINGNWATPDYYTTANWANSPPMAKFVDTLPGLTAANANNLGQYLPVAVPDKTTYPGTDYYIIELREYQEKMHSDLGMTTLRGYVQVDANGNDVAPIHYLGPIIVAERDRPVRVLFRNKLPTGAGGDLFIPVDTTVMGAGKGPMTVGGQPCDNTVEGNTCASYTQNRADIHLHGGRTPWISDGTPHQWIVPNGENTPFTHGVSMRNVPDMPDPGPGATTYYFTNQQSARLMFYHDHAFGITRLNVYAGEAAGYLITDKYEQDLVDRGLIPADQIPLIIQDKTFVDARPTTKYIYNPATGLFDTPITVPTVRATDPLWNWGSGPADASGIRQPVTGDLWLPHVYMPAQLPTGSATGGVNPFGRWMYGPWFYPATAVTHGPVINPYYDPNCGSSNPFLLAQCETPGQPPLIPGTPNVSMGMEAFQDSAVVNGTAFPSLTVDPRAYRFRILNAASDRFQNLSFYEADPAQVSPDPRLTAAGKSNLTEVKMLPASIDLATANNWPPDWPVDGRDGGVPDPAFRGPSFLQIATEGGFLPKPVVIEPQPITYITDPTAFWVGVVDKMGLALGPAERADVIVDFSAYAGKTLILYNDAPAAWPARVPGYDYFTGAPDLRDSGGYGTGGTWDPITGTWAGGTGPLVGYAPNTRTVMQVIVRPNLTGPANSYNQANLEQEFTAASPVTAVNPAPVKTLFERAQEPIIVGQSAYAEAYPNSYFPANFPWEGVNQINDQFLQFVTLAGEEVKLPAEPKGIHDEMGASFDPEYGRMSGNLAMQLPNPTTLNALLILYGYSDIPSEVVNNSINVNVEVLPGLPGVPGTVKDGTQIWKISHNGVDTHPIHFHIFDVQLINRVGWDGQLRMPEPNELGWKDTVKISPLMDTIVAVRPRAPSLPFGIPNSLRPLNPAIPIDSAMGFTPVPTNGSAWPFFSSIDWTTGEAYLANDPLYPYPNFKGVVTNVMFDFGWEYVWHCHILSHEEMDMMRSIILRVPADTPPAFDAQASPVNGATQITWNDPTPINYAALDQIETYRNPANEIGFNVYRSIDNGTTFNKLNTAALLANSTSYTDTAPTAGAVYQVEAFNANGSTFSSSARAMRLTLTADGGHFTSPGPVDLKANIPFLPPGMTITKVDFYNGATLLGTDTAGTTQFAYSWANVPKGVYTVTAKATDSLGGVTTSAPITVTVSATVTANFTISGSATGPDIGFCETIALTSTSTTTSGSIASYSWSTGGTAAVENLAAGLVPGTYPVTLTVTNTNGEIAQVTKNVVIVNHAPVAIPGGPYSVSPGGSVTLNGSGTDPDACSTSPLTYAWNVDNKGTFDYFTANPTLSYSLLSKALGLGTHTMTLQVTDANGGIGTATTTVTVFAVSLTASPASHQVPGTPVSFTAVASGGTGSYEYQFQLKTGATWNIVQNFSANNIWNWNTTGVAPGTYTIQVDARSVGSTTLFSNTVDFVIDAPVTLTASPASPQVQGTPVAFTAQAGGPGNFEYQFWLRTGTTWKAMTAFSASNVWTWNTSTAAPGTYLVSVYARIAGTTAVRVTQLSYTISTPPDVTSVTLTPSPASPRLQGTPISFTGAAAGGSGYYEYRFQLKTGTTWATVQNFSTNNVWNWNTTAVTPGTYTVQVDARSVGSATVISSTVDYVIIDPLTLTASLASPQVQGTPVSFTAQAGGPGNFEYQFWLRTGTTWKSVQGYGASNVWNWNTSTATPGTYLISVYARVVGTTAVIVRQLSYTVTTPSNATSVTLTPAPTSPQLMGTPIAFTGSAVGGSGYYEYRFQLKTGVAWATVQNFSSNSVWNWNTTAVTPGTYTIQVDARSVGTTTVVSSVVDYVIIDPLTLTASPASPQVPGTPVSFTAQAGGQGNFEYQFWLRTGTTWKSVQGYSASNVWNWNTATAAPGTYLISVYSRVVGTTTATIRQLSYTLSTPPNATGVTLTPAPSSPQLKGTPVSFTGAAAGGSGYYEYRFQLNTGTTWATVQNFSSNAVWNWNTTNVAPGTYSIQVDARSAGSTTVVSSVTDYVIIDPLSLTAAPASPQVPGTPVSFTAQAGGPGNFEYQFLLKTGTTWATVQSYSTNNVWNWNTATAAPGTYQVSVYARIVGTTTVRITQISYTVSTPPNATSVTLTPLPASPQLIGTQVAFSAAAAGGSGYYEYRFQLKTGTTWATVQNFSSNAAWNWNTTGVAPGTYSIQVDARSVGSTTVISSTVDYVIFDLLSLTATPASPQVQGTPVTVTAQPGIPGNYEYQFWLRTGTTWKSVQGYSTNAVWNWNTTNAAPGTYLISVYARIVGTTTPTIRQISYVIN